MILSRYGMGSLQRRFVPNKPAGQIYRIRVQRSRSVISRFPLDLYRRRRVTPSANPRYDAQ